MSSAPIMPPGAGQQAATRQTAQARDEHGLTQRERAALEQAAADFEALFTQQMMATMRRTVPEGELLPTGNGEKIFRDQLDGEYAKLATGRSGGKGLKEALLQQLLRAHDNGRGAATPGGTLAEAQQALRSARATREGDAAATLPGVPPMDPARNGN